MFFNNRIHWLSLNGSYTWIDDNILLLVVVVIIKSFLITGLLLISRDWSSVHVLQFCFLFVSPSVEFLTSFCTFTISFIFFKFLVGDKRTHKLKENCFSITGSTGCHLMFDMKLLIFSALVWMCFWVPFYFRG